MSLKHLFYLVIAALSLKGIAQHKIFSFDQVQSRNDFQEWKNIEKKSDQIVEFSADKINLRIDKNYQLTIISKTSLPDKGIIYLCKDEKSNPITVMLIDDVKMYLYAKSKRFLINFKHPGGLLQLADMD
jgi:hypothetical protein